MARDRLEIIIRGIGEVADAQSPLTQVVVGGLTASTLITLVLIPIVCSLFHRET